MSIEIKPITFILQTVIGVIIANELGVKSIIVYVLIVIGSILLTIVEGIFRGRKNK